MEGFLHEIKEFADAFVALQSARHRADYSYDVIYDRNDTLTATDRAADAIDQLDRVSIHHRRGFVAHLLFKRRSRQEIQHG